MDNRLIVASLYGLVGAVTVAGACYLFTWLASGEYTSPTTQAELDVQTASSGYGLASSRRNSRFDRAGGGGQDFDVDSSPWQSMIDQKNKRLEEITKQLQEVTRKYDELKRQHEASLEVAATLISDSGSSQSDPAPDQREPVAAATPPPEELVLLQLRLEQAQEEMAAVRTQLEDTQTRAETEFTDLFDEHWALQQTAFESLARIGADAAPVLADLLESDQPQIRMWSAQLLGELGANAREQVTALRVAVTDRDDRVRAAARRALERIEGGGN